MTRLKAGLKSIDKQSLPYMFHVGISEIKCKLALPIATYTLNDCSKALISITIATEITKWKQDLQV